MVFSENTVLLDSRKGLTRCKTLTKTIKCSYNSNIQAPRNNKFVLFLVFNKLIIYSASKLFSMLAIYILEVCL
jgi:hypothetical protein